MEHATKSITAAIVALYLAFFAVWCLGAAMGEAWTGADQPLLLGMPLWFVVSCLASFAGAAATLIVLVRGWLK